jgi:hypothetical protein
MKSLQNQYNLIKEGKGNKDVFVKSAKTQFPDIPNYYGFNETVNELKYRNILNEGMLGIVSAQPTLPDWFKLFNESINEAKAEEKKPTKEVVDMETRGFDYKDKKNIDNVYGEQFLKGFYTEMQDPKNEEKTVEELKSIVAKNLAKDQLHYVKDGQFGIKGVGYTTEAPGLGTPKEAKGKYKSSGYGNLNESYGSNDDFDGTGLIVVGRTQIDNNEIADMVDETDYYGVWNAREGYWFFPESEETLDSLEMELEQEFSERGIDARFESQLNESLNEAKKKLPKFKNIPSWAKYLAQHSDGEWYFYEETPTMIKFKDGSGGAWKQDGNQIYSGVKTDGNDWDKTPTYYKVKNGTITESLKNKQYYKNIAYLDKRGLAKKQFSDEDIQTAKKMLSNGEFNLNEVSTLGLSGIKSFAKKYNLSLKSKKSGGRVPYVFLTKDGKEFGPFDPTNTTKDSLLKKLQLNESLNENTLVDIENQLLDANIGDMAYGGGYGPFEKVTRNTWKNVKANSLSNSESLASFIGGFNDFRIESSRPMSENQIRKAIRLIIKEELNKI